MKKSSEKVPKPGAGTLEKGLTVLEAVEKADHGVSIQEIAATTGIQRLAVYRLLSTLESRGYVRRSEDKLYRSAFRRRRILVGYLGPLSGNAFRTDLTTSIKQAASEMGVDLIALHNSEDDAVAAMTNAESLLDRRVDAVIFFQPVESLGHMVADRLFSAGVPFITVERPIHGGVYFGANNYQAGKLAGQALAKFARARWSGRFDRVVLLEGVRTSTNVQARLAGVLVGIREILGDVEESRVVHVEGKSHLESGREAMASLLRRIPPGTRLLVSGFNDLSSVGALEAVTQASRERDVAIVGQNAAGEGRAAIRARNSCFIASVAYFPERYGIKLMQLASDIVRGEQVPPAVYTDHMVLNRENVDRFYPAPRRA